VQGMGGLTTEQLVWNDRWYLSTHAPSTCKIPATGDIPEHDSAVILLPVSSPCSCKLA